MLQTHLLSSFSCLSSAVAVALLSSSVTAQLTWTQNPVTNAPTPRTGHAVAAGTTSVLFGGTTAFGIAGDTWTFDASGWHLSSVAGSPLSRTRAAMSTVDGGSGLYRAVLFGGVDSQGTRLGDTWQFYAGQWFGGQTGGPSARADTAMVARARFGDALLFGGHDGASALGDTWTVNAAMTWTAMSPASSPPARHRHAMGYVRDNTTNAVVMFGGQDGAGNYLGDTWVLTQSTGIPPQWVQATPTTSPSPRAGHSMRYSVHRDRLQLFGGTNGTSVFGDTWEWDGANWLLKTTNAGPSARAGAVLFEAPVTAPAPDDSVLFGGAGAAGALQGDTWTLPSTVPASVTRFAPIVLSPQIQWFNQPWLGGQFLVGVNTFGPVLLPHLLVGFSNTVSPLGALPLDLGPVWNDAVLRVDPAFLFSMSTIGGLATVAIDVPNLPALASAHVYMQGILFLAGNVNLWLTSGGIDCVLGVR